MAEGRAIAIGPCWACGQPFGFDPDRVPAVLIDPVTQLPPDMGGDPTRACPQPLCDPCIMIGNRARAAQGRPSIPLSSEL